MTSATLTVTPTDANAEVTISHADSDPGTDGYEIALSTGVNRIVVDVVSADRSQQTAYTVTINRARR